MCPAPILPNRRAQTALLGSALLHGVVLAMVQLPAVTDAGRSAEQLQVRLQPPQPRSAAAKKPPPGMATVRPATPAVAADPQLRPTQTTLASATVVRAEPAEPAPEPSGAAPSTPAPAPGSATVGLPTAAAANTPDSEPDYHADYLDNPRPDYPAAARRRNLYGVVRIEVEVDADGRVKSLRLAGSAGSDLLDDAALAAVQQWRFVPASRAGKPVEGQVVVPIRFAPPDARG